MKPGVGKIGTIFLLDSGNAKYNEITSEIAMTLCLHTAAAKPSYTFKDELPEDAIKQAVEEAQAQAQDKLSDKMPEKAKEKALAGLVAKATEKLLKRDVLMEQELATQDEPVTV